MKIGVLGSDVVAQTLATGFLRHGHDTMIGTRDKTKLAGWHRGNSTALLGSFSESATFGEAVVLTVKGLAATDALRAAGSHRLSRKPVIDATIPSQMLHPGMACSGPSPATMNPDGAMAARISCCSLRESIQLGGSRAICQYKAGRPTIFICGNDEAAEKTVRQILDEFGWETADMGPVEAARAIEPLCMLRCIAGFLRNEWTHALKLLRE